MLQFFFKRRIVTTNIKNSFPEKTPKEISVIRKVFYRNLTDVFVETIKTISAPKEELSHRITFVNADVLRTYKEKKQSVFLLTSHQCNWEWMTLVAGMRLPMPIDFVYDPHPNEFLEEYLIEIRTKFGVNLIERGNALMELMRNKGKARIIAIMVDETPKLYENKFWSRFLNQPTAFRIEPEQLPKFTAFPVFFAHIWRTSRGHYNVELVPLAKPPYAIGKIDILSKYSEEAEILIRKYPGDWLWSNRRWSYPPPESADQANQINVEGL